MTADRGTDPGSDGASQSSAMPWYLLILLAAVLLLTLRLSSHVAGTGFVGYADPAAYGEVAANILAGRGPVQDFVDFFFFRYSSITHRSEHWLTLYTLMLMPSIAILGKTALAVKLPALISYFLLPFTVFLLGRLLVSLEAAFFTALFVLFHPYVIEYGINGWPDLPFTVLAIVCLILYLQAVDVEKRWLYPLLGLILGATCWFRATGFLVLGGIVGDMVLSRRDRFRQSVIPWLIVPALIIGYLPAIAATSGQTSPFAGSHGILAATMGYLGNPQEEHWQLFWNDPPSLGNLINQKGIGTIVHKTLSELSSIVRRRDYFEINPSLMHLVTLPLLLAGIWGLIGRRLIPESRRLIILVCVTYLCGLAVLFKMNSRYLFLCIVLLALPGWEIVMQLLSWVRERFAMQWPEVRSLSLRWYKPLTGLMVLTILSGAACIDVMATFDAADAAFPFTDDYLVLSDFELMSRNLPDNDAVMMTLPWSFTFHTGHPAVMIPYGGARDMLEVCRQYSIHWLVDSTGKGERFLAEYPEFVPWSEGHRAVLYHIEPFRGAGKGLFYERSNRELFEW